MAWEVVNKLERSFLDKGNIFEECVLIRVLRRGSLSPQYQQTTSKKIRVVDMGSESRNSKKQVSQAVGHVQAIRIKKAI